MEESFDKKIHNFNFTPKNNGGESVHLMTTFHDNGDGVYYTEQELTLQSYGNSASLRLYDVFTPENLRKLATELEFLYVKSGITKGPDLK